MIAKKFTKALMLAKSDAICIEKITPKRIYMKAGPHLVILDNNREGNSCTCEYGSLYGVNQPGECYHVLACKYYVMDKIDNHATNNLRAAIKVPDMQR